MAVVAPLAATACSAAPSRPEAAYRPVAPRGARPATSPPTSSTPAPLPAAVPTTVTAPVSPVAGWSTALTALPPGGGFTSVSCLSDTYCIAAGGGDNQADVDATGGAGVTDSWDGAAWADPSVYFPAPAAGAGAGAAAAPIMPSLSCTHGPLCVIVDGTDHAASGDGTDWSTPATISAAPGAAASPDPADPGPGHPGSRHAAVTCSGPGFCAAVDNTGHVAILRSGHWSGLSILGSGGLYVAGPVGLSCPGSSACLAVVGPATFSWDGTGWHPQAPWTTAAGAAASGTSLSCPAVSTCWLVSGSVADEWTNGVWAPPRQVDPSAGLDAVSCPTTSFCVAADAGGSVVTWDGNVWSPPRRVLPPPTVYTGDPSSVSCPNANFCMVIDGDGDYATYRGPAAAAPGGA